MAFFVAVKLIENSLASPGGSVDQRKSPGWHAWIGSPDDETPRGGPKKSLSHARSMLPPIGVADHHARAAR
jgi:hypothetical protein